MSRKGNCWDNVVAESFFSTLKKERVKKRIQKTHELVRWMRARGQTELTSSDRLGFSASRLSPVGRSG